MKTIALYLGIFLITNSALAAGGARVLRCDADDGVSVGQGAGLGMLINVISGESASARQTCEVVLYYGYEYGCAEGLQGMCSMWPRPTTNLTCSVEADGGVRVSSSDVPPQDVETVLVDGCGATQEDRH